MTVSVLIVDDSGFFRKRLTEILNAASGIQVVGVASNGREGVEMAEKLKPDVITMDYEMPVMDGITAVKQIMARQPTPILMFSSLTYEGARVTLDALDAGAVDFLPKNFEEIARDNSQLQNILRERILDVAKARPGGGRITPASRPAASGTGAASSASAPSKPALPGAGGASVRTGALPARGALQADPAAVAALKSAAMSETKAKPRTTEPAATRSRKTPPRKYAVVAIGTSTGGPIALQRVLTQLPANFPAPIVLVQHMPASFTPAFAERLDKLCKIEVRHAEDGDELRPGVALLAPGGKQMMIEARGAHGRVRILPGDDRLNYKPCVDITFGSLARSYAGKTLGIILTGMGADGKEGCRMMKETGAVVWSQDEQSSVIYGMPMAVAKAGLSDEVMSLDEVPKRMIEGVS